MIYNNLPPPAFWSGQFPERPQVSPGGELFHFFFNLRISGIARVVYSYITRGRACSCCRVMPANHVITRFSGVLDTALNRVVGYCLQTARSVL